MKPRFLSVLKNLVNCEAIDVWIERIIGRTLEITSLCAVCVLPTTASFTNELLLERIACQACRVMSFLHVANT